MARRGLVGIALAVVTLAGCRQEVGVSDGRPSVDAGPDQCVGAGDELTLTATSPGSGRLDYRWSLERGPAGADEVVIDDPTSASTTVTGLTTAGEKYAFRVLATNRDGLGSSSWVTVTVGSAGATGDFCTMLQGPEALVAGEEGSYTVVADREGDLSYAWEAVTTNGEATVATPEEAATVISISAPGAVVIRVTVTDDETGEVGASEMTARVNPQEEVTVTASAGAPLVRTDETVTLTASVDGEFDDITYDWTIAEGPGEITEGQDQTEATLTPLGASTIRATCDVTANGGAITGRGEVAVVSYETDDQDPRPHVDIEVEGFGSFRMALEVEAAPNTVANFLRYADEGFYEGVLFHRVVTDFVIQAGGFVPGVDGMEPKEATRPPVAGEAPNGLSNIRGTVAMALRGEDADSGDTQFFVNLVDNALLDQGPPPFTVFAEVVEGMDVVDAIAATPVDGETPVDDVVITRITRVSASE